MWESGSRQPQPPAKPIALRASITADQVLEKAPDLARWVETQRDPVFEGPKTFRAIPLAELLPIFNCTNSDLDISMRCRDGYMASLTFAEAIDGTGFLAIADESSTNAHSTSFAQLKTKSGLIDPGPLYLFWLNDTSNRPRPYQIEAIEFHSIGETLSRAKPTGSVPAPARRGFELFKKNCSSCHSVNGAGGRLAVDLNFPMNVTEYWDRRVLKKLLSDPASVRANAKMPAFPQLTQANLNDIIAYLKCMREQKLVR